MVWSKTFVGAGSCRRSMSCRSLLIAGVCLAVSLSVAASAAEDWPHYLGPNFDLKPGVKEFTAKSATKVWDAKVGTGMCSVSIADGLLYTMGNDGKKGDRDKSKAKDSVYCLDARTGEEKWTFDYPCLLQPNLHPGGPSSTPTIHEGKVYTLSKLGHIFCLDAKTGKKLWDASAVHYKPKKPWWGFAASPTVAGDVVIYNVGDKLIMLSEKGELIWGDLGDASFKETHRQKILEGLCWSKPVLLGDLLYARDAEGTVICLELK